MSITNETRRESYDRLFPSLTVRQKIVLAILQGYGDMTAQEVADTLCFLRATPTNERNFAAPRLTELADKGLVRVVGKTVCKKTGRTVAVWSAVQTDADTEMRSWLDSLERGGKRKQSNDKHTPGDVSAFCISM